MSIELRNHQLDAVQRMRNGCILCGGVGSGKSRAALSYYYLEQGGDPISLTGGEYMPMDDTRIQDLYIITTARKRDTLEWNGELIPFLMTAGTESKLYNHKVIIDSWNNIGKYSDVTDAFFIFDEQRVVGSGAWVKAFLKITMRNNWILLSATPGDTWSDYIPVFIANGFYKNRTEFIREHIIYKRFSKFPQVDRYVNTKRLIRLRDRILVDMDFDRQTVSHHEDVHVGYDVLAYKAIKRDRWNPFEDKPIKDANEFFRLQRKLVNSDESRSVAVLELLEKHPKAIIFYNFDYELDILKELGYAEGTEVAEWNGHKHQPMPEGDAWVYLVQYNAGCEGWNCVKTDTIIFYSLNYSYKVMEQASGRIDRMDTPYKDLYYYHLKSNSWIDIEISKSLANKKDFNEGAHRAKVKKQFEEDAIAAKIAQRRRQVLVHSVIYYRMNDNIVDDQTWSKWALELEELQKAYPEVAANLPYAEEFKDFDHSSGYNLPLDDPWAVKKAKQLLQWEGKGSAYGTQTEFGNAA